ncbi:MAG: hypothetical protein AAF721_01475 [Myxococcota bacterium]
MALRALPPPRWDLVVESFSEAAFLWSRWDQALDSPQHTLDGVVHWVEERLLGALDGVRLGGDDAVRKLLVPALSGRRARRATAAAYLLASGGPETAKHVVDAFETVAPRRLAFLRRGIECSLGSHGLRALCDALPRLGPEAQAVALDALAFRRFPLPPGLDASLRRDAPAVQRSGLRLSAAMREPWCDAYIEWGLQQTDPALQVEATYAGTLRGRRGAADRAYELVSRRWPGADALLPLCGLAHGNRLLPVLQARVADGEATREVFDALASIGTVEAADVCAAALDNPEQSRLAADALRAITSIDPRPGPGDPRDEDAPRDQLLLPVPSVDGVRRAWAATRSDYRGGHRYFEGKPFTPEALGAALRTSSMRRRTLLASELMLRTGGARHVTTKTWTAVQRAQLRGLPAQA